MAERQLVKYTFWKVPGEVLGWPDDRRTEAAAELAAGLDERAAGTLLTYSTVGMRGDCDMLVWQAADTLDLIQQAESAWRATALGARLTVAHSFLAMMRPSPYLGRHRHPDQEGRRTRLQPAGGRYLFVYPMVKKRIWYRLPYERRKAMIIWGALCAGVGASLAVAFVVPIKPDPTIVSCGKRALIWPVTAIRRATPANGSSGGS